MKYRLGIDVGGTNTDAVILDSSNHLIGKAKTPNTDDVTGAIDRVLTLVLQSSGVAPSDITHAMLGTIHCTKTIAERDRLSNIGIIRLGAPATLAIKPLASWPRDLKSRLGKYSYVVEGGHEYDGREIAPLNEVAIREIAQELKGYVSAIAVNGVFSPVNPSHEKRTADLLREDLGDEFPISLSHEISSIGLLERENAAILNAAVIETANKVTTAFQAALERNGIEASVYLTQNDGTLMSLEYALRYPIRTVASGTANSIRGAAYLSGLTEAVVVDVGGTTTNLGVLEKGFPRESTEAVEFGGVRTNFRVPDVLPLSLGGGSLVQRLNGRITVRPESVGSRLTERSIVFGGDSLTITDIAVGRGMANIGDVSAATRLPQIYLREAFTVALALVEEAIDRAKMTSEAMPVVVVGGGSVILPSTIRGSSAVIHPEHFEVANAIGAAVARVGGEMDRICCLNGGNREKIIGEAKEAARQEAIRAGAEPSSVKIIEVDEIPLAYMPEGTFRMRCKAVGSLA